MGCCGFPVRKEVYYGKFDCIEIQKTFYSMPEIKTAIRWKLEAPESFVFTLKAPQHITHPASSPTYRKCKKDYGKRENYGFFKNTQEIKRAYQDFKEFALELGVKYILFQTPPSFKPDEKNMASLINFFVERQKDPFTFVLELRGWQKSHVERLNMRIKFIHCVDPFTSSAVTEDTIYWRLHGKNGYNYKYNDNDLCRLIKMVENKKGFIFFNNIYMWEDALRFKEVYEKK